MNYLRDPRRLDTMVEYQIMYCDLYQRDFPFMADAWTWNIFWSLE